MPSQPVIALFDAHCHLARDADHVAVTHPLSVRAEKAEGRLLCGERQSDWELLEQTAATWPGTTPVFGIHPWHAAEKLAADWTTRLEKTLTRNPAAWVGEIGLDGAKYALALKKFQEEVFIAQLAIAKKLNRPIVLHVVKTAGRILELLDAHYLVSPRPFLVHSYNGPQKFVPPFLERGAYFSAGPRQTREGFSAAMRGRARLIPKERILLESDEYLTPGNDAAQILVDSLQWLAEIKNIYLPDLAKIIANNVRTLLIAVDGPKDAEQQEDS